ncbi:hypothetical protein [Salinilacihabitans rarus]|uniref:hypothetical protein n=1 Tax=Salinilacihabitans rarus TaxID=2961596 RepID=UPI0020C90390|nr:hypothetical protein [Salinilacihabitans rarus]
MASDYSRASPSTEGAASVGTALHVAGAIMFASGAATGLLADAPLAAAAAVPYYVSAAAVVSLGLVASLASLRRRDERHGRRPDDGRAR